MFIDRVLLPRVVLPACLAATVSVMVALGCGEPEPELAAGEYPARMARGECLTLDSCDCGEDRYGGSLSECLSQRREGYEALNRDALAAGLDYDGTCPARQLSALASLGCAARLPDSASCAAPCRAWHGQRGPGQACEIVVSDDTLGVAFDSCDQGLSCLSGFCVDPCAGAGALPTAGQPCPEGVCADGARCDTSDPELSLCVAAAALPGVGEACRDGACDSSVAVCVPDIDVCAQLPGPGEACIRGRCRPGFYCAEDGDCASVPPLVCSTVGGAPMVGGDGDGDGCRDVPEECKRFVECAAVVMPSQAEFIADTYAEQGSCWCGTTFDEAQVCAEACRTQLAAAIEEEPTVRECHGRWCPIDELDEALGYGPSDNGVCPDYEGVPQVLMDLSDFPGSYCAPPCVGSSATCPDHAQTSAQGICVLFGGPQDLCGLRCFIDPFVVEGSQCQCGAICRPSGPPDGEGNLRGICTFDD